MGWHRTLSIPNTRISLSADSYGNSFVSLRDSNTDSIKVFNPFTRQPINDSSLIIFGPLRFLNKLSFIIVAVD